MLSRRLTSGTPGEFMKRLIILLACCLCGSALFAQTSTKRDTAVGVFAGRIAPTSATGDRVQMAGVGVEQWVADKGSIRLDILRSNEDDPLNIVTFDGSFYVFKWLAVPFGIGWYDQKNTDISSVIGMNAGVGLNYWFHRVGFQLQGNYHFLLQGQVPDRKFVSTQAGVRFKF